MFLKKETAVHSGNVLAFFILQIYICHIDNSCIVQFYYYFIIIIDVLIVARLPVNSFQTKS